MDALGPGAIVACVTIGNGETIFASRNGAIFGYALMWCFALGAVMKGLLVYSDSRFIVLKNWDETSQPLKPLRTTLPTR